MAQVLTTTASLGAAIAGRGMDECAAMASRAGCSGLEVRRELFEALPDFRQLGRQIEKHGLFCVYSAPVELWLENGQLNKAELDAIIPEALAAGARFVKTSLGHYRPGRSHPDELKRYWRRRVPEESVLKLTVENDQTAHGGKADLLLQFLRDVREQGLEMGMTFDTGNWSWTGEDALVAAGLLAPFVVYIHLKHVEQQAAGRVTLPLPAEDGCLWRQLLALLPKDVPRTIEFPLADDEGDTTRALAYYTGLIATA